MTLLVHTGKGRDVTSLLGAFGLLALGLAALGIYGVVSYGVAQRASELRLRLALEGRTADVLRGAMAGGARLPGALTVVALLAVLVPARRARRVDPAESLRAT